MNLAQLDIANQTLNERIAKTPGVREILDHRFDISWIFHDNALEGLVLTLTELHSATDDRVISDSTLIPFYDDVRNHKQAIALVRELAARKKTAVTLETIKRFHQLITPLDEDGKEIHYRRDHPIHRLYFHEITSPDKISYKMRRLGTWLVSDEFKNAHPVSRACVAHVRLMQIFPWTKNSGKVARLLTNLLLLRDGYVPAIIHSIDRQRYYESLRVRPGAEDEEDDDEADVLQALIVEALEAGVESAMRIIDEHLAALRKVRAA